MDASMTVTAAARTALAGALRQPPRRTCLLLVARVAGANLGAPFDPTRATLRG